MIFLKEMYHWKVHLWSMFSEAANTWAPSCNWQELNYTGIISSSWVNTMEGMKSFLFLSYQGAATACCTGQIPLCQICRLLSTGHKPYVLGQRQALYLIFPFTDTRCCLCPNCYINNYEWNSVQNGCGIPDSFDSERIQYSVIIVNRKEINSLLNRIAI